MGFVYWQSIARLVRALYRFTKSDIITTVIPVVSIDLICSRSSIETVLQTLFAVAAAPLCDIRHLPGVIFWIWLHLLQFNVSNQLVDPEEDGKNKSFRPIPAGLISVRDATLLRWLLTPACWWLSASYSNYLFTVSFVLSSMILWYNELRGHEHWLSKNAMTALGYSLFELGGTLTAGKVCSYSVCASFTIGRQDVIEPPSSQSR